ncbi:MAG TPA: ribonuclease P protein component [Burkholderiales bacterium]
MLALPTTPAVRGAVPPLGPDDYAAVFKSRERARSAHFSLHWRVSTAPVSRFGTVVAKRLTRTAIRRNLIKRQGRALFALACPPAPLDVVLRLTRNPNEMERAAQYAELQGLFAALPVAASCGGDAT